MEDLKAKGNEAFKHGRYLEATDFYTRAAAAATDGVDEEAVAALYSNCSVAYLKLGELEKAKEEAERCIAAKKDWHKGHFRLGEVLFATKEYAAAETAYKQASHLALEDRVLKQRLLLTAEARQGFFFRQLSAGKDFCVGQASNLLETQMFQFGLQMRNFIYLVGDAHTREAVVIDPAWDVQGILKFVEEQQVKLVGAIATHYHVDHTGGLPPPPFESLGIRVPGVREIAQKCNVKVYVNKHDADEVERRNLVPKESIVPLEDGAELAVGLVKLRFIHTPGHTPGSQCIRIERVPGHVEGLLLSGDTLFIGSCGRLDMPDCDAMAMHNSLQRKLALLPDSTRVYPGHDYGGSHTSIGRERRSGLLKPVSEGEWQRMHKTRV